MKMNKDLDSLKQILREIRDEQANGIPDSVIDSILTVVSEHQDDENVSLEMIRSIVKRHINAE